jgi:hypothetical protein
MVKEKGHNKKKREQLNILAGIDLCACGGGDRLRCHGICRKSHIDSKTKRVECGELYQIDRPEVNQSSSRRPRRTWKFGRQKDVDENKQSKQQRREKRERDRVE